MATFPRAGKGKEMEWPLKPNLDSPENDTQFTCKWPGEQRKRQGAGQRREKGEKRKGEIHLPSSTSSVSILPFHQQKTVCTIAAHEGTLAAITFNASGSKLASASEKVSPLPPTPLSGVRWMAPAMPRAGMERACDMKTDWSLGPLRICFRGRISGLCMCAIFMHLLIQ